MAITARITSLTSRALDTIQECLDPEESARTRLDASKLVLDWAHKFRRVEDLSLAVAEIRQHLGMGDGDDH